MSATDELLSAARAARDRAHAPYSGFKVGAAVRAADGSVHVGANVENAAYPEGICAEAAAIAAMVMAGQTRIAEILVIAASPDPVTPCGGCRQKIREFATADTPVHLANTDGALESVTLEALLPKSFGPEFLS